MTKFRSQPSHGSNTAALDPHLPKVRSADTSHQFVAAQDSLLLAFGAFGKRAVVISEDEHGHIQLESSPSMSAGSDSESSRKLIRSFEEVCGSTCPRSFSSLNSDRPQGVPEVNTTAGLSSTNIDKNVVRRETVRVAEETRLREWYIYMFNLMQQCTCKLIAKALIAKIHPKKSGSHPYNGGKLAKGPNLPKKTLGSLTKPVWWPPEVDHQEPDHLDRYRKSFSRTRSQKLIALIERVFLLDHMLARMYHTLCGADRKTRVTAEFVEDGVNNIQAKILRLENGERAWQLWQQVLSVRAIEEKHLSGEIQSRYPRISTSYETKLAKHPQPRSASPIMNSPSITRNEIHRGRSFQKSSGTTIGWVGRGNDDLPSPL